MKEFSKREAEQPGCSVDVTRALSVISLDDKDGGNAGSNGGCLMDLNHGGRDQQEEGPIRLEDSEKTRRI